MIKIKIGYLRWKISSQPHFCGTYTADGLTKGNLERCRRMGRLPNNQAFAAPISRGGFLK